MGGGHFDYENAHIAYRMGGRWEDEELNELFFDLFGGGYDGYRSPFARRDAPPRECEFGPGGGGLAESLDFWISGDTSEEDYREDVRRFKAKWIAKRTPKRRTEFYQERFTEYAREITEKFGKELGEV